MDWLYSNNTGTYRDQGQSVDAGTFRNDTNTTTIDSYFTNELFVNLKKNYEERINNIEKQVRTTYDLIENDQVIQTMKLSHVSDNFRQQRINEIIEDSLNSEKEVEIEKLNKVNAYLKTELQALEQENQRIRQAFEEEASKFQNTLADMGEALQQETDQKNQLLAEKQKLVNNLAQYSQQKDTIAHEREQYSQNIAQKDAIIDEMKEDFEKIRDAYGEIERAYNELKEENANLLKSSTLAQNSTKVNQSQIEELRNKLKQAEDLVQSLQKEIEASTKEKDEIISKYESLPTQVKQIIENEQKASVEMMEEMKAKYKVKIEEQMAQIMDLQTLNENLVKDVAVLKEELEESKLNCEKIIALMKNDMRVIKNEWEKRCQEVEHNAEITIADLKTKHQVHITQLQNEYQILINKKMSELQTDSDFLLYRPRAVDIEAKNQLEERINQIEKDYILKTKHENILNTQLLELKTQHAQELKNLQDKYENSFGERVKGIAEKNRFEFENSIEGLKVQNNQLEQQIARLKSESQTLTENLNIQTEKAQRLTIELEESERSRRELKVGLDEVNQRLQVIKEQYEQEQYNSNSKSSQIQELTQKEFRYQTLDEQKSRHIQELFVENSGLKQTIETQEETMRETNYQIERLTREIKELSHKSAQLEKERDHLLQEVERLTTELNQSLDTITKERNSQEERIRDLNEEIAVLSQRIVDEVAEARREEIQKAEVELVNRISSAEAQLGSLTEDFSKKDEKIDELNATILKLEDFITDLQAKTMNLEAELAASQNDSKDMQVQLEKLRKKLSKLYSQGTMISYQQIPNMREELDNVRRQVTQELRQSNEVARNVVTEIIKRFQAEVEAFHLVAMQEKDGVVREYRAKLQEQVDQREKAEVENEKLKQEIQGKNKEVQDMWKTYQSTIEKLEHENNGLRDLNNQKTQEFQNLQEFVGTEMKRLQEESQSTLTASIQQVEARYKEELELAAQTVAELRDSHNERLQKFEEMVGEVEGVYTTYLGQQKDLYEEKIHGLEKELEELVAGLQQKEKETVSLKKEIGDVNKKLQEQKAENIRIVEIFEEKIGSFRDLVRMEEEERNLRQKTVTTARSIGSSAHKEPVRDESELEEEIALLRRELKIKDYKIEELQRGKEAYKKDVLKYKEILERKERNFESQHRELMKDSKQKEREIEELQSLLKKSIDSFNSTLNTNLKITSRLERDADEIAKTVRLTSRSDYKRKDNWQYE